MTVSVLRTSAAAAAASRRTKNFPYNVTDLFRRCHISFHFPCARKRVARSARITRRLFPITSRFTQVVRSVDNRLTLRKQNNKFVLVLRVLMNMSAREIQETK